MLLKNIIILLLLILGFHNIYAIDDDLCRLIELDIPNNFEFFSNDQIEDKLFYKTEFTCQNKPVFRSLKSYSLYQFQSPNNRWWTLYETKNSTYQLGIREWCDAWNFRPLLTMPLGRFQHPLSKQKRTQRWQRVIFQENNRSYSYKPITNVHLKCYYSPSTSNCQTEQLTFLFDLTETTTNKEFQQMKFLTKTLIWLLYNQTKIALSYYHGTTHLINTFDNQTSSKSLEHLYDSLDALNQNFDTPKRSSVRWSEAIHTIATQIYKRRLILPIPRINLTDQSFIQSNDSMEDEIYTEPYPLIYNDDEAIKTILNITTYSEREKRSLNIQKFNPYNHLLVILTSRSKYLYDYQKQDRRLAQFISSVPLRILVIDFNQMSNKNVAEYIHSAFIHNSKYALASLPTPYNYIETYEQTGDTIHDHQLFDHYQRLCYPLEENRTSVLIEINRDKLKVDCTLLTFDLNQESDSILKDKFEYTFYQTEDQCYSAAVYRSLADRNLYIQRKFNGQWLINHVDPHLPSRKSLQQKLARTTTTTLPPEFYYATDYAHGSMMDEYTNETSVIDLPTSIPYCSDNPGIAILWESEHSPLTNDYFFQTPRRWISDFNQSDLITPICNKYQISCLKIPFDLVILIDSQQEYVSLIRTFLHVFLALIQPKNHRLSLIILSSTTTDSFQFHLPLTSFDIITNQMIDNYLIYSDHEYQSVLRLHQHFERISEYLFTNQQNSSQKIFLTISSRLNFDKNTIKTIIQRYSSIRYMVLDPYLQTDEENHFSQRLEYLRSLTSEPYYSNLFWTYSANRDLTFNTIFRFIESLCGSLR